jgi:hypothetical protein
VGIHDWILKINKDQEDSQIIQGRKGADLRELYLLANGMNKTAFLVGWRGVQRNPFLLGCSQFQRKQLYFWLIRMENIC